MSSTTGGWLPARLSPAGYLLALLRQRPWLAVAACVCGAVWLIPGALLPLLAGYAIDTGIAHGADTQLDALIGLIVALAVCQALAGSVVVFTANGMWIHGASTTQRTVATHTARLGASLSGQAAIGDVMAISSSDVNRIGNALETLGRTFGSVIAFVVVGLVLFGRSPLLTTMALVGVPLAVLGAGLLIGPLQQAKTVQRERLTAVNAQASDIVSGLRILRGIGGERRFLARFRSTSRQTMRAGMHVARAESWLAGAEVLLPGLVTVTITWLGARLAAAGTITIGELVAFYGASAFLVIPIATTTEAIEAITGALVAARKVCRILRLRATLTDPGSPARLPDGAPELYDSESGLSAVAGKLTVVDAGPQAEQLASRLARFADPACGERTLIAGIESGQVALTELRHRVVYAHNQDIWFSGVLRTQLRPERDTHVDLSSALWAADASDIVAGLPDGMDEVIGERGREVSGGQRQRLNLARALVTGADVLLLDEPTSAVDAHTEARIARRVAELRHGKTTVVFSQSPLWTSVADLAEPIRSTITPKGRDIVLTGVHVGYRAGQEVGASGRRRAVRQAGGGCRSDVMSHGARCVRSGSCARPSA